MITLYIAETSKGFDLAPAVGMFFPELEKTNNTIRPRTEFDLLNFLTEFLKLRIISMDILIHFRENKKNYFLLTKDLLKQNLKRQWTSFEKK